MNDVSIQVPFPTVHTVLCIDPETAGTLEEGLTGRAQISNGSVQIDGHPVPIDSIEYMNRSSKIFGQMSVAQNVFGLNGQKPFSLVSRWNKPCQELIDRFNLSFSSGDRVASLSSEQQVLMELLRCYTRCPQILILNGILQRLSYQSLTRLFTLLEAITQNGTYVLYLTRHMDDTLRVGKYITVLTGNETKRTFTAQEVKEKPQLLYREITEEEISELAQKEYKEMMSGLDISTRYVISRENIHNVLEKCLRYLESMLKGLGLVYIYGDTATDARALYPLSRKKTDDILKNEWVREIAENYEHYCGDYDQDNYQELFVEKPSGKQIICVPLRLDDHSIGLLQMAFAKKRLPTQRDWYYLEMIAKEILLVLENSRLMGRLNILQESHHRIKNNLQMITSMLTIQKMNVREQVYDNEKVDFVDTLDEIIQRISMMARFHDTISRGTFENGFLDVSGSLNSLRELYASDIKITLDMKADFPVHQVRITSLLTILNELIMNSIKHNSEKEDELRADIRVYNYEHYIGLRYRDNGQGFPKGFVLEESTGVGLLLIRSIVMSEFHGSITAKNENGAVVDMLLELQDMLE